MDKPVEISKPRSWFWPIQLGAWGFVASTNFIAQYSSGAFAPVFLYANLLEMFAGGVIITTLFRYYLKRSKFSFMLSTRQFILFVFGATLLQALCWLLLIKIFTLAVAPGYHFTLQDFAYNIMPLWAMSMSWSLVYLIYQLINRYHNTELEKWKLEAQVQQAHLGALKSQVNPHFMFNALNNIRALILEDPQLARKMITRFSELLRHSLQHTEQKETTVADEIDMVTQYLELVKIQYEDKLQYTINVDEQSLAAPIPPMTLQLLAENAIKHGIAQCSTGGILEINISNDKNQLLIIIKNTGTLTQKDNLEESLGIGLNNITGRLRLLYGDRADLQITEQQPFVTVTIKIEQA
jgi:two-component system LytT family sensor kinase